MYRLSLVILLLVRLSLVRLSLVRIGIKNSTKPVFVFFLLRPYNRTMLLPQAG